MHTLLGRAENSHTSNDGGAETCPLDFLHLKPCRFEIAEQRLLDSTERLPARANASFNRSRKKGSLFVRYYDRQTILNLYRSRYSLGQVAKLVRLHEAEMAFTYTHVVAARPDAKFLAPLIWQPLEPRGIRVANYEHGGARWEFPESRIVLNSGGVSDRFAYGDAATMLDAYMTQYTSSLRATRV